MGVREKMKRAFSSKKSGDSSPSDVGTTRIPGVEYYKPGEVPRSRYRGKWDQGHQDKLHAFSFTAAFRSRQGSGYSCYSPSGLKAQSRRPSHVSKKSKSDVDDRSLRRKSTNPRRVDEDSDDKGYPTNVGRSRPTTTGGQTGKEGLANGTTMNVPYQAKTATRDETCWMGDVPFTAEELTGKLTTANSVDREL